MFHCCSGTNWNCFNFFYSLCSKLHTNVLTDTTGNKIKMDNALQLSPIVQCKREEVPANDFKLSLWLALRRKGSSEHYFVLGERQGKLRYQWLFVQRIVFVEITMTHPQMKPLCLIMLLCAGLSIGKKRRVGTRFLIGS